MLSLRVKPSSAKLRTSSGTRRARMPRRPRAASGTGEKGATPLPARRTRPIGGAAGPRPGSQRGPGRGPGNERSNNASSRPDRGASYGRPRSPGNAKPANSGSSRSDQRPPRPPAAAGSRPAKSWSARPPSRKPGGKPGGRPGRPPTSFRDPKPVRKKPEA